MRFLAIIPVAFLLLRAQDPPPTPPSPPPPPGIAPQLPAVLSNTGKPMTVNFQCTPDDIQAAGLDCSEHDPCPIYLELNTIESSGIRIFVAGNIHTTSATLYSIILGTDDNGHTWREPFERIRGATFDRIQFSGTDAGWVGGQLVYPLPQDAFFLQTTDGGKTWRRQDVFNESRLGALQQFFFEDAKRGSLIIDHGPGSEGDRYELYESPDGGDSWSIKQTSVKPLAIRRAASALSSDWRVRADAASKSFHLEHRDGARWLSVGAFTVNLGACKPE